MTTPQAPNPISVSDVRSEANKDINGATAGADLDWLNGFIKTSIRPSSPNLESFYNLAWFTRNIDGNCNDANNNNCNCNCGNIQCNATANCTNIQCVNCDSTTYLQANCNCACTYNCVSNQNCYSYNCNCSKIICTKLYYLGMMPRHIFEADQRFGEILIKTDPDLYNGYVAWAKIVVDWMDGNGPAVNFWDTPENQKQNLSKWATNWAYDIATPWAEYMAFKMGELDYLNKTGLVLHKVGGSLSKAVGLWNKVFGKSDKPAGIITGFSLVGIFVILKGIVAVGKLLGNKTKGYANV